MKEDRWGKGVHMSYRYLRSRNPVDFRKRNQKKRSISWLFSKKNKKLENFPYGKKNITHIIYDRYITVNTVENIDTKGK